MVVVVVVVVCVCVVKYRKLECGPMPNLMVALQNIGGALFNAAKFG